MIEFNHTEYLTESGQGEENYNSIIVNNCNIDPPGCTLHFHVVRTKKHICKNYRIFLAVKECTELGTILLAAAKDFNEQIERRAEK